MNLEASASRDRVAAALGTLRKKVSHPEIEHVTEAATKALLVEPLLHAMGFEGLDDIEWEHHVKASGEHIDYVLRVAGNPTIAVEAKSFGTDLADKHAAQVVQYATVEGIEWCLLTNGREMRVFNCGLKGDLAAKHLIDLDLLAEPPADVLDVLTLFSKEGMANQASLKGWMREAVLDRALRLAVLDSHSATTMQLAETARDKTGLDLTSEDVSRWFAHILGPAPAPHLPKEKKEVKAIDSTPAFWLFPVRSLPDGTSSPEELKFWTDVGMWGIRRSAPYRSRMKGGDLACFYATGVGVVAWAQLAGPVEVLVTAEEWPEPTPMEAEVFKVPLRNVQWLPEPTPIDEQLRGQLDAYKGKKPSPVWSWLVQTTSKLSERDFNLLVKRPSPQ